jgi:hypothetical protein
VRVLVLFRSTRPTTRLCSWRFVESPKYYGFSSKKKQEIDENTSTGMRSCNQRSESPTGTVMIAYVSVLCSSWTRWIWNIWSPKT